MGKDRGVAVLQSKEFLDSVIDSIPAWIFIKDKENRLLKFNKAFADTIGLPQKELLGHSCFDLYPRDQAESYWRDDKEVMKHGKPKMGIVERVLVKGEMRWVRIDKLPCRDLNGEIIGVIGFAVDITEQKKAEEMLTRSEEKYRALFNASRDAIILVMPPSWKFVSCNPATLELFGAKDEVEFASKHPWELSPEFQPDGARSAERALEFLDKAMNEGSSFFEWVHMRFDGREFTASVLLSRVEIDKGSTFLQATVRDITEQKRAEERLRLAFKRQEAIMNSANDAVIMIDHNGNVSLWNKAAEKMFGYRSDEILGEDLHLKLAPKRFHPDYFEKFPHFQETGQGGAIGKTIELMGMKKDGSEFPMELSLSAIDEDGRWAAIGIVRDTSERHIIEDELRKKIVDLERFQKVAVGREMRVIELKKEVKELRKKLGEE